MNFFILLAVLLAVNFFSTNAALGGGGGNIPGGWTPAEKDAKEVVDAANFATQQKYPGKVINIEILAAMKQVSLHPQHFKIPHITPTPFPAPRSLLA